MWPDQPVVKPKKVFLMLKGKSTRPAKNNIINLIVCEPEIRITRKYKRAIRLIR